mmetsp:Transcript_113053/g.205978  ORF Transcript_113053/g.205978 Transcript_113053/m.205978 type:complete len:205 (-) Transcript_113053:243-857(-)
MSCDSVGKAGKTQSRGGGGLPLQRLESTQVALRVREVLLASWRTLMIKFKPPLWSTRSLRFAESPAMLPKAQTACSRTSSSGDSKSCTKMGKAPASTTARVCSAVPDAMFVSTHSASNCRPRIRMYFMNSTKRGRIPLLMASCIGGLCSTLRSFRSCRVAWSWASGEELSLRIVWVRALIVWEARDSSKPEPRLSNMKGLSDGC